MLADPRANALDQRLLQPVALAARSAERGAGSGGFPDFDDNLREAFLQETELFLESQLREDRRVTDLLTANYTFLNERLAAFYGVPNVYGAHFRRVALTDPNRLGLLGQGSILTVTLVLDADVAGRAREVAADQHPRLAAPAAAARRAGADRERRRRRAARRRSASGWQRTGRTRSARAATPHGSDGLRARELQRDRQVADDRGRGAGRRDGRVSRRHEVHATRPSSGAPAEVTATSSSAR